MAPQLLPQNTYVCIATRFNSKRLPGKALLHVYEDISLLEFLIRRFLLRVQASQIIICTTSAKDDDPIVSLAAEMGVRLFRGDQLDVMGRFLGATNLLPECQHIVRVTGDNPLTDVNFMIDMAYNHSQSEYDYSFTRQIPRGTRCEIISRTYLLRLYQLLKDHSKTEYMTYYLLQDIGQKICQYHNHNLPTLKCHSFTVDTPADLAYIRSLLSSFHHPFHLNLEDLVKHIHAKGLHRDGQAEEGPLRIPNEFILP